MSIYIFRYVQSNFGSSFQNSLVDIPNCSANGSK
nr:MAG TPA: hypothetical protein [Caudoviricetes sp.]